MSESVKIATIDEIPPGSMKSFEVNGTTILVANVEGNFYAMGGLCTHVRAPLESGWLDGYDVICIRHGAKFDVTTGEVIEGPATDPEPVYAVRVEGNDLLVEIP
jgi:glycine betaine catabolism B